MALKFKGGGSLKMRPIIKSDVPNASASHDFKLTRLSGGTAVKETESDSVINKYVGAEYFADGGIAVKGLGDVEIVNMDPSVGTVDTDGSINRVSSGLMRLVVRGSNGLSLPLMVDLRGKSETDSTIYQAVVKGSLSDHCRNTVDSRIDGTMNMTTNGLFFTTQDHSGQNYVRNPNLWCSDIDLTAISPWNSNGGSRKAGTLITQRHIINASHYEYPVGTVVRFVASDGTVYNRTVEGKKRHPDYDPYYPDLTIYTLDSDLPAAVSPCKVMPSDWASYLVNNRDNRPASLGLDQEEKGLIVDFNRNGAFLTPIDADRLLFHESKIVGDSGNPAFLIVNDELVLITAWTYGGAGSGTPVADFISDLNQMIVDADTQAGVSTGYTVTEADFSAWPNFSTNNYLIEDSDIANNNASLWVEAGLKNGKMSYRMHEHSNKYRELVWMDYSWVVIPMRDYTDPKAPDPLSWEADDMSGDDTATPDLAIFSTLNFSTP